MYEKISFKTAYFQIIVFTFFFFPLNCEEVIKVVSVCAIEFRVIYTLFSRDILNIGIHGSTNLFLL